MNGDTNVLGLAAIRRNRGVSLEQIAETTKISMRALQAIEVGEFNRLPGGIYNTNYLRQYAQAIDFDAGTLLDYYYRKTGLRPSEALQDETPRSKDKGLFGGLRPSTILGL
jgi:cytoskeletal protein RodZ